MRPWNILIACEESQTVCIEMRKRGHNAFSNDIQECSGGHPEWHKVGDSRDILRHELHFPPFWDLIIAHPPCDYLTVSNNNAMTHGCQKYTAEEGKELRRNAILFFEFFTHLSTKRIAIENPIGIMSTHYRKPDQIIQPWQFGHGETKATCLWLFGLNNLIPTYVVSGREQRLHLLPPSPTRKKERSKTFPGIARAMAEQWTPDLTIRDI